jgi:transposase
MTACPAGLDVHKDVVVAAVPDGAGSHEIHRFSTTTPGLVVLRDWLVAHEVSRVGMEATGVYWKPVYYMLEDDMEVWLYNARHMHNVPGRKTDVADAAWICELTEFGLARPSFVPPVPIRELRNLTRYRKAQILRTHPGSAAAGQDPARRRGQAVQRRYRCARQVRAGDVARFDRGHYRS